MYCIQFQATFLVVLIFLLTLEESIRIYLEVILSTSGMKYRLPSNVEHHRFNVLLSLSQTSKDVTSTGNCSCACKVCRRFTQCTKHNIVQNNRFPFSSSKDWSERRTEREGSQTPSPWLCEMELMWFNVPSVIHVEAQLMDHLVYLSFFDWSVTNNRRNFMSAIPKFRYDYLN